jgi:glucosamine--fructose-6-phosphate aminotransferase (isomerizing)
MYRTMHGQPDDLRRLLTDGWQQATEAADRLSGSARIVVAGTGTSYHAALVGLWLLRAAGVDARAVSSFDAANYPEAMGLRPGDAVIVMAHTGETGYSAQTMAHAAKTGATVISVGSLTAEHVASGLVLRTVEKETAATYTSSHLTAMTVLAQIATLLGEQRGSSGVAGFRETLTGLPDHVATVLARESEVIPIAEQALTRRVYAIGAGSNEATATEFMIKAREAAYADVDALAAEQYLHGPIVSVNAGDLAGVIHVDGVASKRITEIATVLDALNVDLWIVGRPIPSLPHATTFTLPDLPEVLSPLLAVIPMQLLAFWMAERKGTDPDSFRWDDPLYERAFGLLTL